MAEALPNPDLPNKKFKGEVESTLPVPERDWAELHPDALMVIFRKVGMHEVLLRTSKVCGAWRKAARDDPLFWPRIDMGMDYDHCPIFSEFNRIQATVSYDQALANMTKAAVNWGGNRVEHLRIRHCCDYDLLQYIAQRARNLKSLSIIQCHMFCERMAKALGTLKQLEELEIAWFAPSAMFMMEFIGMECPELKCLKLKFPVPKHGEEWLCVRLGIPKKMIQLEYLQLTSICILNEELMKILERCPNLETLDLCGCKSYDFRGSDIEVKHDDIRARCSRIDKVLLPDDISYSDSYYWDTYDDVYADFYGYSDDDI
ncbi:hypothetical protein LUZ61_016021 [Rhynchospora tenuis]|uniref:F-box domain-containing protein n=1 Tax=Rhynchospora tenuis TaxID=198213 RepID=A0AAD5Z4Q6_9POAL|nr:hypothetical protein LUZ61_016021 [Rhynchospora tenuis]